MLVQSIRAARESDTGLEDQIKRRLHISNTLIMVKGRGGAWHVWNQNKEKLLFDRNENIENKKPSWSQIPDSAELTTQTQPSQVIVKRGAWFRSDKWFGRAVRRPTTTIRKLALLRCPDRRPGLTSMTWILMQTNESICSLSLLKLYAGIFLTIYHIHSIRTVSLSLSLCPAPLRPQHTVRIIPVVRRGCQPRRVQIFAT